MDEIRSFVFLSVGRVVLFSFLAIALLMLSVSYAPVLALKIGGSATLLLTFALVHRSSAALGRNAGHAEIGALLAAGRRPRRADARREVAEILCLTYLAFARLTSGAAAVLFAAAVLLRMLYPAA